MIFKWGMIKHLVVSATMQNMIFINTAEKAVLCPMTDFELLFCQALSQQSYTWSLVSNFHLVLGWNNFFVGLPTGMEFIPSVGRFESESDMPLLSFKILFHMVQVNHYFSKQYEVHISYISKTKRFFDFLMTFWH